MCRAIFTIMALLTACGTIQAAPAEHWFEKANQYYTQQEYDSASFYYDKIIESGINNSAVFYNMGNACFRLKKNGLARLYYEKAAKLSPADPDIISNIKFINANIADRVPEPEKGFFASILWYLHMLLPLRTQLWIFLIALVSIAILIAASLFSRGNGRLWFIYLTCLIGLTTCFLGLSIGFKIYDSEKVDYAIVLSESVDARNEPEGNKVLFTAHEGTKFRVRKTVEGWSLVSLPNGYSGWVKTGALGNI